MNISQTIIEKCSRDAVPNMIIPQSTFFSPGVLKTNHPLVQMAPTHSLFQNSLVSIHRDGLQEQIKSHYEKEPGRGHLIKKGLPHATAGGLPGSTLLHQKYFKPTSKNELDQAVFRPSHSVTNTNVINSVRDVYVGGKTTFGNMDVDLHQTQNGLVTTLDSTNVAKTNFLQQQQRPLVTPYTTHHAVRLQREGKYHQKLRETTGGRPYVPYQPLQIHFSELQGDQEKEHSLDGSKFQNNRPVITKNSGWGKGRVQDNMADNAAYEGYNRRHLERYRAKAQQHTNPLITNVHSGSQIKADLTSIPDNDKKLKPTLTNVGSFQNSGTQPLVVC